MGRRFRVQDGFGTVPGLCKFTGTYPTSRERRTVAICKTVLAVLHAREGGERVPHSEVVCHGIRSDILTVPCGGIAVDVSKIY